MHKIPLYILCLCLAGCAVPHYLKKRDFSKVPVGTPYTPKIKALRNPTEVREPTSGPNRGAQVLVFEWDKPGDPIINRMYSYAVIRNGQVAQIYEDPLDKYDRNPKAFREALAESNAQREYYARVNQRTAQNVAAGIALTLAVASVAADIAAVAGAPSQPCAPIGGGGGGGGGNRGSGGGGGQGGGGGGGGGQGGGGGGGGGGQGGGGGGGQGGGPGGGPPR